MDEESNLDPHSKRHVHRVSNRRKYFLNIGSFMRSVPNVSRILLPEKINGFNFVDPRLEDLVTSKCVASLHASNLVSASPILFQENLNQVLVLKH